MAVITLGPTVRKPRQIVPVVPSCDKILMQEVLEYMQAKYIERGYWRSATVDNLTVAQYLGADMRQVQLCFYNLAFQGKAITGTYDCKLSPDERQRLFVQHNLGVQWRQKYPHSFDAELRDIGLEVVDGNVA